MEIKFLNYLFNYVVITSKLFNIDESHSLKHSMDVYYYSDRILENEIKKHPYLENHKNIIFSAAILHDMCDKKYVNEKFGIENIVDYMTNKMEPNELYVMLEIISTMSYSTVKKNGYPDLGKYQMAYHVVREADLLASYDFDRSIIYHMNKGNNITAIHLKINEYFMFKFSIFVSYQINHFFIDNYFLKYILS
jgi:HD superfamily phosphodiesterase